MYRTCFNTLLHYVLSWPVYNTLLSHTKKETRPDRVAECSDQGIQDLNPKGICFFRNSASCTPNIILYLLQTVQSFALSYMLYSFLYLQYTVQYAAVLSCALISILHWPVYNAYTIVYFPVHCTKLYLVNFTFLFTVFTHYSILYCTIKSTKLSILLYSFQ